MGLLFLLFDTACFSAASIILFIDSSTEGIHALHVLAGILIAIAIYGIQALIPKKLRGVVVFLSLITILSMSVYYFKNEDVQKGYILAIAILALLSPKIMLLVNAHRHAKKIYRQFMEYIPEDRALIIQHVMKLTAEYARTHSEELEILHEDYVEAIHEGLRENNMRKIQSLPLNIRSCVMNAMMTAMEAHEKKYYSKDKFYKLAGKRDTHISV